MVLFSYLMYFRHTRIPLQHYSEFMYSYIRHDFQKPAYVVSMSPAIQSKKGEGLVSIETLIADQRKRPPYKKGTLFQS